MQPQSKSILKDQGYDLAKYLEYFRVGTVVYESNDGFIILVPRKTAYYLVVRARNGLYSREMKRNIIKVVRERIGPIFSDIDGNHQAMFRLVKKLGGEVFPDNTILFR